jgi:hypothetical protein
VKHWRRPAVTSLVVLLTLAMAACGGDSKSASPATPTTPTPTTPTPSVVLYAVSGRVTVGPLQAGSPALPAPGSSLPWVKVEVTAGKADLIGRSATTDGEGRFRIDGLSGDVTLKAARDGCAAVSKAVTVSAELTVNFELATTSSGKISDTQAAADIVTLNMQSTGGGSFRRSDLISRWELPVPVYLDASLSAVDRNRAIAALDYWQSAAGLTYTVVTSNALPRLLIRSGTDGLASQGGGRALVDGTFSNNRVRSALVVYEPGGGTYCQTDRCDYLFRHELGHTLGIYENSGFGLMSNKTELDPREKALFAILYSLPHGSRVQSDGSWQVVVQ